MSTVTASNAVHRAPASERPAIVIGADLPRTSDAEAARTVVVEHMNADHAGAGTLLCQRAADAAGLDDVVVGAATLDHVDRFGCDYVAGTSAGLALIRLAFDEPVTSLVAVRAAVVALVRRASAR